MLKEETIQAALDLANRSQIAILGADGEGGYPNIKAMIKCENRG
jgi:general stress protein 26